MDQSNSKWSRWIAISLCALALSGVTRNEDSTPRQQARANPSGQR